MIPVAAAAALALSSQTLAAPKELKLSNWTPPKAPVNAFVMVPWIKTVNAESGGAINIKWYPGERVGERFRHDASGGTFAEEDAPDWAREWISLLE